MQPTGLLCPWDSAAEYWSGLPFPSPGDLPDPGIEPMSLMSPPRQAGSLPLAPPGKPHVPAYMLISFDFSLSIVNFQSIFPLSFQC